MSDSECIFCRIVAGDMDADRVYADDRVLAFRDIQPQAPTHVLIIPREHIPSVNALEAQHEALAGHMMLVARTVAAEEGIAESGYRLVVNTGGDGGQAVDHIHLHLLGGRGLSWPPG